MMYLLYHVYARLTGEIEAFLYSQKGANALDGKEMLWESLRRFLLHFITSARAAPPGNEHLWLVSGRVLVFLFFLAGIAYYHFLSRWQLAGAIVTEAVAAVLAFSYTRDKYYYLMRDRTDNTTNGHRYQSPTDSSEIHFNYVQRRNMFYISLGVLAAGYSAIILFL